MEDIFVNNQSYQVNFEIYRKMSSDLSNYSKEQLKNHFTVHGYRENRIYNLSTLLEKNSLLKYFKIF